MKSVTEIILRFRLLLLIVAFPVFSQECDMKNEEIQQYLGSYLYDNVKTNQLISAGSKYKEEFTLKLFENTLYKFVWVLKEFPREAIINLYSLDKKNNKKLIYSSIGKKRDKGYLEFLLSNPPNHVVVEYVIPPSSKGCVSLIVGFNLKNDW
ncbi:MAG: hypothetical protein KatS3mg034_0955 [Vicingaceae bacterium]|nr:MAG: hypothetical protein KatS3mg034_0955 [Vicingaceae bacterium]